LSKAFRWAVALSALAGMVAAEDGLDASVFLIPRDQLSTQELQPFMQNGRVLDPESRTWGNMKTPSSSFPMRRPALWRRKGARRPSI
jgi:hypothetical protein